MVILHQNKDTMQENIICMKNHISRSLGQRIIRALIFIICQFMLGRRKTKVIHWLHGIKKQENYSCFTTLLEPCLSGLKVGMMCGMMCVTNIVNLTYLSGVEIC